MNITFNVFKWLVCYSQLYENYVDDVGNINA